MPRGDGQLTDAVSHLEAADRVLALEVGACVLAESGDPAACRLVLRTGIQQLLHHLHAQDRRRVTLHRLSEPGGRVRPRVREYAPYSIIIIIIVREQSHKPETCEKRLRLMLPKVKTHRYLYFVLFIVRKDR